MSIVKLAKYILGKLNGLRLRRTIWWLKMQGAELGHNVYIGKNVSIGFGPESKLKIGNNVAILDNSYLYVNSKACVEIGDSTFIGRYCDIFSLESIIIGEGCAFAAYCSIIDTDKDYTNMLNPRSSHLQKVKTSPVKIEKNVWLGYKVTVLRGVTLGENCVIGANAVVTKNIPASSMAVGVPAKVIKCFDEGSNKQ